MFYGKEYTDCIEWAARTTFKEPALALEFGVASGRTLKMIAEHMYVIGFDSFEGLPEDWREGFPKGSFSCPVPNVPNAEIVHGWFEESLPTWLDTHGERLDIMRLLHIDCDLYSSTKTVLDNLWPYMAPGLVIVFDEYHGYPGWQEHEAKAWEEFVEKNNVQWGPIGIGPEQLVVQLR